MHDRGVTKFRRNFFVSQCRNNLWASLQCFRKFGISKKFIHSRGYHVFLSKIFCLTFPKKFVNESYCFWENFLFRKVFTYEKGEYHIFPSKTLVPQSRITLWASLKCFKQIVEPERFMYNRGYHVFISKFLGPKVPKKFVGVGDPSIFRKFGVIEIIYKKRGYHVFFCRIFFVSPCRKYLKTNPTVFERFSRIEKFLRKKKGCITFFCQETLVSQSRKISWASLHCFRKIVVSEIFMYNRGYHVFCEKF